MKKTCTKCGESLKLKHFDSYKRGNRQQIRPYCKQCRDLRWNKVKEKYNRKRQADTYGITVEELNALYESSNSRCAICDKQAKLVVDHNHLTGEVRGLLCRQCNAALGMFNDSEDILASAISYLKENGSYSS